MYLKIQKVGERTFMRMEFYTNCINSFLENTWPNQSLILNNYLLVIQLKNVKSLMKIFYFTRRLLSKSLLPLFEISVGSGPEIFGLGLTALPNVRARAYSGLPKFEHFKLGFGHSGLSGFSGFSFQFYFIFM